MFRITQAEARLHVEYIEGENEAIKVHYETGKIVRKAIKNTGKTLPEYLPVEPHIKEVKKLVKKYDNFKKPIISDPASPSTL